MDLISYSIERDCEDDKVGLKKADDFQQPVRARYKQHQPSKQEFHRIRARCLAQGTLYEDPDFPANDFSVYRSSRPAYNRAPIEWKRPGEIVSEPRFVTDGYSRFDVCQGQLGNCWFIASCATLTSHPVLFNRVVPQDNSQFDDDQYAGVFHFYFWQYGEWVEVIVDDRLPVGNEGTVLLYMSSSVKEEFWAALLEKAYAKLYGSYSALESGTGVEGMVDLAGGITEFYSLNGTEPDDLFERVERNLARKSLITAGTYGDPNKRLPSVNLFSQHEYSVTKVARLTSKHHMLSVDQTEDVKLICVRNPWGQEEWRGAWGDHSKEWVLVMDEDIAELNIVREDGEFWMNFKDFVNYFDDLSLCYQCPCDMSEELKRCHPWEMMTQLGEWKRGSTAGGSNPKSFWRNPQYLLELDGNGLQNKWGNVPDISLIVGLMQMHHRARGTENLSLRLLIYRIPDHAAIEHRSLPRAFFKNFDPVEIDADFKTERELVARYNLPPGRYVIIPHTRKPNEESEFLLRIFADGRIRKICYYEGDVRK